MAAPLLAQYLGGGADSMPGNLFLSSLFWRGDDRSLHLRKELYVRQNTGIGAGKASH